MFEIFANFIEWYGTIAILGAYGLVMFHAIPFQGSLFYIMNLSGAIALVIGSAFKRALWNNVFFYFIWGVITSLVYFNVFHHLIK
jgi:hypothetical protein